jgi:hypothetical protein
MLMRPIVRDGELELVLPAAPEAGRGRQLNDKVLHIRGVGPDDAHALTEDLVDLVKVLLQADKAGIALRVPSPSGSGRHWPSEVTTFYYKELSLLTKVADQGNFDKGVVPFLSLMPTQRMVMIHAFELATNHLLT